MTGPWFRSALRSVLRALCEGAIWTGAVWVGAPPCHPGGTEPVTSTSEERGTGSATEPGEPSEQSDLPSGAPLSSAERAQWASLLERLR